MEKKKLKSYKRGVKMRVNTGKDRMFFISLLALLLMMMINFSPNIADTIEVFKTNIDIEIIEKQGYKAYNVLEGTFKFELPSLWSVKEEELLGDEIIYHLNFLSTDRKIYGFIQTWRISKSLTEFLDESEKSSIMGQDLDKYSRKKILINNKKGFLIEYERQNKKGNTYKAYEAFIEGENENFYRASFFMQKKDWHRNYKIILNRIIQSIEVTSKV